MIATLIEAYLPEYVGAAFLYRVDPPIGYFTGEGEGDEGTFEYVVSSAIDSAFDTLQPETFLFPANEQGDVLNWLELPGSVRGIADPEAPLTRLGYTIE